MEEEHQDQVDRNSQMELEMYESSNARMTQCGICGRSFREDRIAKHEAVCSKTHNKQRKTFNMQQQRLDGEAQKALKDAKKQARFNPPPKEKVGKMPKWKQQHLEFQNALKAGRGEQPMVSHFGSGPGMAPPPPQDMRVECPHCYRRFAEQVAERHIPRCKNIVNKPKPMVRRR
jgi:hypothetical protein